MKIIVFLSLALLTGFALAHVLVGGRPDADRQPGVWRGMLYSLKLAGVMLSSAVAFTVALKEGLL